MAITAAISTFYLMTTSGRPYIINGYMSASGDVVGTYGTLDPNSVAGAASPDHVVIAEDSYIYDYIPVSSSGKIELIANTRKTGTIIDLAAVQVGNVNRVIARHPIPLSKGTDLMFQVYAACAD